MKEQEQKKHRSSRRLFKGLLFLAACGLVMAIGTLLAAFPGSRRRRAIDPVSAPVGGLVGPGSTDDTTTDPAVEHTVALVGDDEPEPEPAGHVL